MQSIKEKLEKSKWVGHLLGFFQKYVEHARFVFVFLIIALVGTGAFLTGRLMMAFETRPDVSLISAQLSQISQPAVNISNPSINQANIAKNKPATVVASSTPGSYVASKTGKAYYFPWCAAAKRIK